MRLARLRSKRRPLQFEQLEDRLALSASALSLEAFRAIDLSAICRPSVGCSSSHSANFSLVVRSTSERMATFPSFALV